MLAFFRNFLSYQISLVKALKKECILCILNTFVHYIHSGTLNVFVIIYMSIEYCGSYLSFHIKR